MAELLFWTHHRLAAHPGTSDEDMLNLALWPKQNNFRLDQVQTFLPTPMATTMYHTERNPRRQLQRQGGEVVGTVRNGRQRKLHKAFLRYHDPENWPLLREALKEMGRADLIGNGKKQLIPTWQPAGTGLKAAAVTKNAGFSRSTATGRPSPAAAGDGPTARPAGANVHPCARKPRSSR